MIRIRIADQPDPAAMAAARADLARLARPTYLGWSVRTAVALAAVAVAAGAVLGAVLPTPNPAPCGYVVEGAEIVPASCTPAADLQHRLDVIRAERSGGRW